MIINLSCSLTLKKNETNLMDSFKKIGSMCIFPPHPMVIHVIFSNIFRLHLETNKVISHFTCLLLWILSIFRNFECYFKKKKKEKRESCTHTHAKKALYCIQCSVEYGNSQGENGKSHFKQVFTCVHQTLRYGLYKVSFALSCSSASTF